MEAMADSQQRPPASAEAGADPNLEQALVQLMSLRNLKSRVDLSTVLYLLYVLALLGLGVFLLTV